MLTGTTEFSFFVMGDPYFAKSLQDGSLFTNPSKFAEFTFAKNYGSKLYKLFNTQESASKIYSNYKAPIYTIEMPFGEGLTATTEMALVGSFHGVFVPLLDNNNKNLSMFKDSFNLEGAQELSRQFKQYLANFFHQGNPNGEGLTKWDKWTLEQPKNFVLTADEKNVSAMMSKENISKVDVIKELDKDNSISAESKKIIISEVLNGRWFSAELDKYFGNKSLWVK